MARHRTPTTTVIYVEGLVGCPPLEELYLAGSVVSNEGFAHEEELKQFSLFCETTLGLLPRCIFCVTSYLLQRCSPGMHDGPRLLPEIDVAFVALAAARRSLSTRCVKILTWSTAALAALHTP